MTRPSAGDPVACAGDAFTITRTFTEDETLVFGDISHDLNPVHYDDRFAREKNLQGRICHGLLVGGMITEVDERNRARAEAILSNQHGETVIEAWLTGVLPGEPERRIMAEALESRRKPTRGQA